jgi:3-isopropylmalate/(R)-2-methylmalate dehydratase large subunit
MKPSDVSIRGRVLVLTEDLDLVVRQLRGGALPFDPSVALMDDLSTDEITPARACYHYDQELARHCLTGLRGGQVAEGQVLAGGFEVLVSGARTGCGSSRETAPFAQYACGIRVVVARSFERIYAQNARNIGLLLTSDFSVLDRLVRGDAVPRSVFVRGLPALGRAIVERGGLFAVSVARGAGLFVAPAVATSSRPMTVAERILASHAGVRSVAPGDAVFARADIRFSHDYVTAMAEALFVQGFGAGASVVDPGSVLAFRDHLTLLDQVMSHDERDRGLLTLSSRLATVQERFCRAHGVTLHGEVGGGGARASLGICHNLMVESVALPGQLVIGTDSHTSTAGALGCLAFGVGATDMANAWYTQDVHVSVPETVRVVLRGELGAGVTAKDVMLFLLSRPFVRGGGVIGKVLEFGGDGVASLSIDERATLANMAAEAGAFAGIVPADGVTRAFLVQERGMLDTDAQRISVSSDPYAEYAASIEIDLPSVPPMVALPGNPKSGVPLGMLGKGHRELRIDIAYGGSCAGGKKADLDMIATVLARAARHGAKVEKSVAFYIQPGSQAVRRYADEKGYSDLFQRAGATLIGPSCGACIRAGPGISTSPDQVTVSAMGRNFAGRSGPGRVYLASPLVVAASAIAGRIAHPDELWPARS